MIATTDVPNLSDAEIIDQYMPLIHKTVNNFRRRLPSLDTQACYQLASMAILTAKYSHDPAFGSWSTFVNTKVRGAVFAEYRRQLKHVMRNVTLEILEQDEEGPHYVTRKPLKSDDVYSVEGFVRPLLYDNVAGLNQLELQILQMRYGIFGGVVFKFIEIAAYLDVSLKRVGRAHDRAIEKIRPYAEKLAFPDEPQQ